MISPSIPPPMNSAAPLSTLPSSETSSPPISSDVLFPLDNELKQLSQSMKPASASRIATITKLALKHVKHYKFIVHHIISFIKTCAPELKLSGLYMVDAICRASMTEFKKKGKAYFEKEPYVHRFETTLPTVTQDIQKKPEADGEKMKKLLSVWRQYYVFSNLFLDKAESTWYSNGVITPSSTNTTTNQPHDPSLSSSPTSSFGHPPNVTKATSASVAPWSLLPGDTTTTTPAPTFSFLPTTNLGTSTTSSTATTQMPLLDIPSIPTPASSTFPISLMGLQIPLPPLPPPTSTSITTSSITPPPPSLPPVPSMLSMPLHPHVFSTTPSSGASVSNTTTTAITTTPSSSTTNPTATTPPPLPSASLPLPNPNSMYPTPLPFPPLPFPHPHDYSFLPPSTTSSSSSSSMLLPPAPPLHAIKHGGPPLPPPPSSMMMMMTMLHSTSPTTSSFEDPTALFHASSSHPSLKRSFEEMEEAAAALDDINWYETSVQKEPGDWVQIEGGCGPDEIKVLSRTLYVGGITKDTTQEMLRGWFAPFGPIDSILINYSKFNCFLKLRTRRQAHAALQANIPHLKLNWGCGFGHKAFFHYGTGTSVLNLKALGANAAFLMTTTVGGIRHGCLRGGLTVEEPDLDFKVYRKFRDMK